jgi:hypothetical protein
VWVSVELENSCLRCLTRRVIVHFYRDKGTTYIVRLTSGIHYKAWVLIEAWRCVYSVLTTVLVFDLDSSVLRGIVENLGYSVGWNLDYDGI